MRSIYRHIIAALICIMIFTLSGTADGFIRVLQNTPNANLGVSLALTGLLNFIWVVALTLVVITPVASIADYLFTHKWPFPFYIQIPALIPLLIAYLLPWTLLFDRLFSVVLLSGTIALTLPLLAYWGVFRALARDYGA